LLKNKHALFRLVPVHAHTSQNPMMSVGYLHKYVIYVSLNNS